MTVLDRSEISAGFVAELDDFGELLRSLEPADLDAPTRCTGWTVRDVAGHMVGQITDVVNGRLEGLGTPEVTEREAKERAGRSAAEPTRPHTGSTKASTSSGDAHQSRASRRNADRAQRGRAAALHRERLRGDVDDRDRRASGSHTRRAVPPLRRQGRAVPRRVRAT